jgi:hypothetical protein
VLIGLEAGLELAGAGGEEGNGLGRDERRHRVLLLGAQCKPLPTRRDHAQLRRLGEQGRDLRRRLDQLLEVVEQ